MSDLFDVSEPHFLGSADRRFLCRRWGLRGKKINSENENEGISEVKGHTGGHLLDILSYSVK